MSERISNTQIALLFDLYWLRYEKTGEQWYELTDYLRDKLVEDGIKISYDDKNKDLIFDDFSMKEFIKLIELKKRVSIKRKGKILKSN